MLIAAIVQPAAAFGKLWNHDTGIQHRYRKQLPMKPGSAVRTLLLGSLFVFSLLTTESAIATQSGADDVPKWGYRGENGPAHWGDLAADFSTCAQGRNQSPIDLDAAIDADLPELSLDYNAGLLNVVNTGHAIQDQVKPGNYVTLSGRKFELAQFHFHSPSEHTVAGRSYPMEVHFVHQDDAGNLLVVGLLVEEGEHNPVLDQLPAFRMRDGQAIREAQVDFEKLLTDRSNYYSYNGSLTTPPCSEGVRWIVLKVPVVASREQIGHYLELLGFDNNRPVQPRNARTILD